MRKRARNLSVEKLERDRLRAIRERRADEWLRRNRSALEAYNRQVEKHGVFSDGLRAF